MASQPAGSWEEAIKVTPTSSHTYSANLRLEWSIGIVPNGGYITAIFYNVARTHMRTTHPKLHNGSPDPITVHLTFLRRTEPGPATFRVQDTKLGSRTSTLHITLSQTDADGGVRDEVAGYITVSNIATEEGPSITTRYALVPPPPPGADGSRRVDLAKLAREGRDGEWAPFAVPLSSMRRATKHIEFFIPTAEENAKRGFVEQWVRFRPYGKLRKWDDAALGFLIDMFPMILETFDERPWDKPDDASSGSTASAATAAQQAEKKKKEAMTPEQKAASVLKFWYPTVLLNVEFKKKLPPGGSEWLYSRVITKALKNGRMDLDIVVLDEHGDVVALSNHVALIVSAERNLAARKGNGKKSGAKI
ncbi:hypothetical protein VTO42DRAFT_3776 [Malbranchea cinnamomea]